MSLPSTYTQLDYIASTGTQYINTGYTLLANDKIEADVYLYQNTLQNYEAIFGSKNNTYQNNAYVLFQRFGGADKFVYNRSGNETQLNNGIFNKRITITTEGKAISWTDGVNTYTGTSTGTANNCINPLFIFDINMATSSGGTTLSGSHAIARLYGFKIYSNNTLVRDFIPCKRISDGEVGLYDDVGGTFYTNQGEGEFIYELPSITFTDNPLSFKINESLDFTAFFERSANCRIKVNGTWKFGMMYTKVNGTWKLGTTKLKNSGTWKDGG